jgi:hypothetical protein
VGAFLGGKELRTALALLTAASFVAFAAPALGDQNNTPPESLQQPLADGCQRSAVGLLTNTSAHWVYVYGDPSPRVAQGVASDPHPAAGDLPQAHDWYDQNFDLRVDAASRYLTGSPGGDTLHIERESGKVPTFVWATDADAVKLWGSWIWDCGHWGPQDPSNPDFLLPGQGEPGDKGTDLRGGEGTEIHPYQAIVITRANPSLPSVGVTEADVFMSTDGTRAHAETQCAFDNKPPSQLLPAYGPGFTACTGNPVPQDPTMPPSEKNYPATYHQPLNASDYSFFVPAPPKPAPGARLRYQIVADPKSNGAGPVEQVEERPDGIQVTIPYKGFGSAKDGQAYAKSFRVGWDGDVQRLPARLEVTLHKLTVNNSLDAFAMGGTSSQVPPGEYGMYLDANGQWTYLNDLAPGLGAVSDGQSFDIERKIGLNVPAGGRVRLAMSTRECDLPHINPCPNTPEVADDNDNPGDGSGVFDSAAAAVGDHVMSGGGGQGKAPNWTLTYNVKLVSPATTSSPASAPAPGGLIGDVPPSSYPDPVAPGSGSATGAAACADTFAPTARFTRPVRASRRRLVLRGSAGDFECSGRPGRVLSVGVAVARRVAGKRCRFLLPGGGFTPAGSCRRRTYLPASGTAAWRLARKVALPRGLYTAWTRSVDAAGNVGYAHSTADRARFRVR